MRSIRLLPTRSDSHPSATSCTLSVKVYRTAPTPAMMTPIVNTFSAVPNSSTSRNPTVVIVVTVWYAASRGEKPSNQ